MTREYWGDTISKWKSSGKSMAEFCREENLNYWTFRKWRNRIDFGRDTVNSKKLVRINVQRNPVQKINQSKIEVLCENLKIQIPRDFDEDHLIRVIRTLRKAS